MFVYGEDMPKKKVLEFGLDVGLFDSGLRFRICPRALTVNFTAMKANSGGTTVDSFRYQGLGVLIRITPNLLL